MRGAYLIDAGLGDGEDALQSDPDKIFGNQNLDGGFRILLVEVQNPCDMFDIDQLRHAAVNDVVEAAQKRGSAFRRLLIENETHWGGNIIRLRHSDKKNKPR